MAQAYPNRRASPSKSPGRSKTFRRGLPANQNQRGGANLGRKSMGGLGRKYLRRAGGIGLGVAVLWELYELYEREQERAKQPDAPGQYDWTGWTVTAGPCQGPELGINNQTAGFASCNAIRTEILTSWQAGENQPVSSSSATIYRIYRELIDQQVIAGQLRQRYYPQVEYRKSKMAAQPHWPIPLGPDVIGASVPLPLENPLFLPSLDPLAVPPNALPHTPRPLPYQALPHRQNNPDRAPDYQWQGGYGVNPLTPVVPSAIPTIAPTVQITPNAPPTTRPAQAGGHQLRPPKRGREKEKKLRTTGPLAGLVLGGISTITEARDLIDDIYKALPFDAKYKYKNTNYLRRSVTPQEKLEAIWKNHDEINYPQAFANFVESQLEDAVYGTIGKAHGQAAKEMGLHVSLQYGGANRRYEYQRWQNNQQARERKQNRKD